jgi:hypothetical protein
MALYLSLPFAIVYSVIIRKYVRSSIYVKVYVPNDCNRDDGLIYTNVPFFRTTVPGNMKYCLCVFKNHFDSEYCTFFFQDNY